MKCYGTKGQAALSSNDGVTDVALEDRLARLFVAQLAGTGRPHGAANVAFSLVTESMMTQPCS